MKNLRTHLDSWLNILARAEHSVGVCFVRVLERVYPRAAVWVRMRQGRISEAYALAKSSGDSLLLERLREMREVLSAPLEKDVAESGRHWEKVSRDSEIQVLQVFHSSITHDTNGYGVRSEQIVRALSENGINSWAMTRLGYPWDLIQHSALASGDIESSSTDVRYHHSTNSSWTLGHPESGYLRAYADQIAQAVRESRANVIHAHSNYLNGLASQLAGQELAVPVVYEMRGLWHETRALTDPRYLDTEHYKYCEKQELRAALLADAVVAISEPLALWLAEKGVNESKIAIVGNAAVEREPVVKRPSSEFVIGYVGSIVEYEGLKVLIDAFAEVHKLHPHARLLLVGDGTGRAEIESRVKAHQLNDVVEFSGRVPPGAVEQYYARLDVAVVPRYSNRVTELVPPLKPMEIMAMGVPLITSDVAPLLSLMSHGANGLVFAAGNARQLSDRLLSLVNQPELCNSMRTGGLAWAASNSWAINAKRYEALYSQFGS